MVLGSKGMGANLRWRLREDMTRELEMNISLSCDFSSLEMGSVCGKGLESLEVHS
jgi:hypothetical protein